MATEAGDRSRIDQLPRQMSVNWPTVTVIDATSRGYQRDRNGNTYQTVPGIMKAYMPTPTVADVQGGRKARSGSRANEPLLNGLCHEMEPIGQTPNGSNATTAKRGAPNPVFAFWLMGFPAEWISGALEAMRSYRKPRKRS